jgi:thioredoxin 1
MKTTLLYAIVGVVVLRVAIGIGVVDLRGSGPNTAAAGAAPARAGTPVAQPLAEPAAGPVVADGRPTLIELGMNSCASCKAMHRVLDDLRAAHGDALRIVAVDIRERPELVAALGVVAIPT